MSAKETKRPRARAKPGTPVTGIQGRPLLSWVGKRTLSRIPTFPAQRTDRFEPNGPPAADTADWAGWPEKYPRMGLLFHGDNMEALGHLLANGFRRSVKCVYIDPPFDSGMDYVRKVTLRASAGGTKLHGHDPSVGEQVQYTDIWTDDNYLQFMHDRLLVLREMLTEDGFIVVHMNSTRVHYAKVLLDEIYGQANFRNDILVKRIKKSYVEANGVASLNEGVDYLLLYSKSPDTRMRTPLRRGPKKGRYHSFDAPGIRPNLTYDLFGKQPPFGRCWMKTEDEAKRMIAQKGLRANPQTGWPEYWLPPTDTITRDTLWDDITASAFTTGYPTEKKEEMLAILLGMLTKPADLVLDCFAGSGTTLAVAQRLGRRWVGCDINKGAVQTTARRLQGVIQEQMAKPGNGQEALIDDSGVAPCPAQLAFSVYRINDYDLRIQHNEAVALARDHLRIERNSSDPFFDGSLGGQVVKIAPFEHPLNPAVLQQLEQELKSRPGEGRDITVVCLGMEEDARKWVEKHNRTRKRGQGLNWITPIDLRTDPVHGKLFAHEPPHAETSIARAKGRIVVEITDFASPAVVERLASQQGLLKPSVADFRSFIDSVMIDPAYDGKVFNIALADLPTKKTEQVKGRYELVAPKGRTTVAVKITDVLGEEVLVKKKV